MKFVLVSLVRIRSGTVRNPQVRETVKLLCADHPKLNDGLKILNVGFGLGIVSWFLRLSIPSSIYRDGEDRFILPKTANPTSVARHNRSPSGCPEVHEVPRVVLEAECEDSGGQMAGLHRFT